jgi:hypothetical protein
MLRKVGKATLARRIRGRKPGYLNWDAAADREAILRGELPAPGFWVSAILERLYALFRVSPFGAPRIRA